MHPYIPTIHSSTHPITHAKGDSPSSSSPLTLGAALRLAAPQLWAGSDADGAADYYEISCQVRVRLACRRRARRGEEARAHVAMAIRACPTAQGLTPPPLEAPLVEAWAALRHADMFLYVTARKRRRRG